MQSKKKILPVKKNPVKKKSHKISNDQADTINTTKQKTFATIQQTFQFQDHKTSTRTTHYSSRRDCLDKMQALKLSPFSSPGKSVTPRSKKSLSPIVVKQKQIKKYKKNQLLQTNITNKKYNNSSSKNTNASNANTNSNHKNLKQKIKNAQKIKAQFQNQFLKRMYKVQHCHQKKITELSEQQMQASIRKINKPLSIAKRQQNPNPSPNSTMNMNMKLNISPSPLPLPTPMAKQKKQKKQVIKQMHTKIKQKYSKLYPNLKSIQLKLLSAVVLIQRLWRQTKVKMLIGQFISPRNSMSRVDGYNATFGKVHGKELDDRYCLQSVIDNQNQQTMKTEKSFPSLSPKSIKMTIIDDTKNKDREKDKDKDRNRNNSNSNSNSSSNSFLELQKIENSSQLLITPQKLSSLNLKDLEISDQLSNASSTKAKQILKYIDMYRQVTLKQKKEKKKKNTSKPNAFNFPQSLSEKCLLQNLYKKRITNIKNLKQKGQQKLDTPIDIFFPSKSIQKSKQQFKSPKKPQIVQLEERFYTQAQDEEYHAHAVARVEKQPIKLDEQTVGSIANVSKIIIEFLINQFSEEFQAFSTKKCLKKKKRRLPGINLSDQLISVYFDNLITFVKEKHQNHFQEAFTRLTAKNFLKIFRVLSQEDVFQQGSDDQEQDLNYSVVPSTAFFQFQPIYQQKLFKIRQQDTKYSTFLSGLIKIHNKCLIDSFSQYIQKQRIESIQFPWDKIGISKTQSQIHAQISKKMDSIISQIKHRIISISGTRLGRLHNKDYDVEEVNLLRSLKEQYKREGKDWNQHQDLLEVRLEIAEMITQQLFEEAQREMRMEECEAQMGNI